MANIKSAKKRAVQSEKRRMRNRWQMSRMKSAVRQLLEAVERAEKDASQSHYRETASLIDKLANKGIIHKNRASRLKSRLNTRVKAVAVGA